MLSINSALFPKAGVSYAAQDKRAQSGAPRTLSKTKGVAKKALITGICAECPRKESLKWYKNKQDPQTDICKACYNRIRSAQKLVEEKANNTTCATCSKKETPKWCVNKEDPTTKICQACYLQARIDEETAKDTACAECLRKKTCEWYTNPKCPETKICQACYKAAERTAKKAALLLAPKPAAKTPRQGKKRKKRATPKASQKRIKPMQPTPIQPIQDSNLNINLPCFFVIEGEAFPLQPSSQDNQYDGFTK